MHVVTAYQDGITVVNHATGRAIVKVTRTPEGWVIEPAPHATIKLEDGLVIEPFRKRERNIATDETRVMVERQLDDQGNDLLSATGGMES